VEKAPCSATDILVREKADLHPNWISAKVSKTNQRHSASSQSTSEFQDSIPRQIPDPTTIMASSRKATRPRPASVLHTTSRFAEGSMNDRVSKMPPMEFLGPNLEPSLSAGAIEDEMTTINRQSFADRPTAAPPRRRSVSASIVGSKDAYSSAASSSAASSSSKEKEKRGFLGPLWDGFREKLSFGKTKGRPVSVDGRVALSGLTGGQADMSGPDLMGRLSTADDAKRPTREEILANYQQLVDSGFFSSHAIHSARRPLPTQQTTPANAPGIIAVPPSNRNSEDVPMADAHPPHPMNAPPPPPPPQARKPSRALPPFYARPEEERKPKLQPFTHVPRPRPIPNNPNTITAVPSAPPPPVPHASEIRGKKRGHEDDEVGKARKLRKASNRFSADLAMPIPMASLRKHFRRTDAIDSNEDASASLGRSLPPPVSMSGIFTRRSFSSSNREANRLAKRPGSSSGKSTSRPGSSKSSIGGGGNAKTMISGPVSKMVRLPPGAFDAMREGKGELVLPPNTVSGPSPAMSAPLTSHPITTDVASPNGGNKTGRSSRELHARLPAKPAAAATPNVIVHRPGGEDIPLWAQKQHQHMRTRRAAEPLKVIPDVNRGIPKVPEIPRKFKEGRMDVAVSHAEDGENQDVEMGTFYFEDSMLC
jgi:hypothetical protein